MYEEKILNDDYPVYIGYLYVADNEDIERPLNGTVSDLRKCLEKNNISYKTILTCDIFKRAKLINQKKMKIQKKKQEYKDLKFKNDIEFRKWLIEKTDKIIYFEDNGQDCLHWFIDKSGEVLHSVYQSFVWNGQLVNIKKLEVGNEVPVIKESDGSEITYDFIVENIITDKKDIKKIAKKSY